MDCKWGGPPWGRYEKTQFQLVCRLACTQFYSNSRLVSLAVRTVHLKWQDCKQFETCKPFITHPMKQKPHLSFNISSQGHANLFEIVGKTVRQTTNEQSAGLHPTFAGILVRYVCPCVWCPIKGPDQLLTFLASNYMQTQDAVSLKLLQCCLSSPP